jgi:hypothetical protein
MKYSSRNLGQQNGVPLPLQFAIKIVVEYRPGGILADCAPVFYSASPESDADAIVAERGWNRQNGYTPRDVWVDGAV